MCKFQIAWRGKCTAEPSKEYCKEHTDIKCVSCGEQATHECEETMGLVCGELLCDNCEHTICENGCNSGAPRPDGLGPHCRKSEQVNQPWYVQEVLDKFDGVSKELLISELMDQEQLIKEITLHFNSYTYWCNHYVNNGTKIKGKPFVFLNETINLLKKENTDHRIIDMERKDICVTILLFKRHLKDLSYNFVVYTEWLKKYHTLSNTTINQTFNQLTKIIDKIQNIKHYGKN